MSDDESKALRKQVLDCCNGHNDAICLPVLVGVIVYIIEQNATETKHVPKMLDDVAALFASIAETAREGSKP
jgi:hypothetical protein